MASNSPTAPSTSLKVAEVYTNDAGKNVAKIDRETMKTIGASDRCIIEIKGKHRATVALCAPLNPPDEGKGIIRLDELTRYNATAAIGYTVVVRRIRALQAESIVVMSIGSMPIIDERYLSTALQGIPATVNDYVMIPYFGGRLTFKVVEITPEQGQHATSPTSAAVAMITDKTMFAIKRHEEGKIKFHISEYVRLLPDIDVSASPSTSADTISKNSSVPFFLGIKLELFIGAISERIDFQKEMRAGTKVEDMVWLSSKYREIVRTEVDEAGP